VPPPDFTLFLKTATGSPPPHACQRTLAGRDCPDGNKPAQLTRGRTRKLRPTNSPTGEGKTTVKKISKTNSMRNALTHPTP